MSPAEPTLHARDGVQTLQTAVNDTVTLTVNCVHLYRGKPVADVIIDAGVDHDVAQLFFASEAERTAWASRHARDDATADELNDALPRLSVDALASLDVRARKPSMASQSTGTAIRRARHLTEDQVAASIAPTGWDQLEVLDGTNGMASASPPTTGSTDFVAGLLGSLKLLHTPDDEAYATIPIDGHCETLAIKSKPFRRYLGCRYYEQHRATPKAQVLSDAIGVLEGTALFNGPEQLVHTRVAEHDGAIYLDLGNSSWQTVKIDAHGWSIERNSPIKFRRSRGMLPLPTPVPGGSIDALRQFLNVESDEDWALLIAWLVQALRPHGPYPLLALHGEQGSAKSTTARVLRSLVDPNSAPLRAAPRDTRDLVIAARNGWVMAHDNLSRVPPWLSDSLCRLSTDAGFATRQLHSDADEYLFDGQRPAILDGIEELATRGDLLDRAIVVNLPAIPEHKRRSEAAFWAAFEREAPGILGALLTAVSTALARLPDTPLDGLPRMADFALWATAAEPALGLEPGAFINAYAANRADANDLALEASPVAAEVMKLIASTGHWDGESTRLLSVLDTQASDGTKRLRAWPKSARSLSGNLKRLAPNLRRAGVEVSFDRTNRRRIVSITTMGASDK